MDIIQYKRDLRERLQLGYNPWPREKAARLMAIIEVFGGNHGFTHHPVLEADAEFIRSIYHTADRGDFLFYELFNKWMARYTAIQSEESIDFQNAREYILRKYNFPITL